MSGPLLVLILEDEALIAMTLEDDLDDAGYAVAGSFATCESVLRWLEHATRMSSLMPTAAPSENTVCKVADLETMILAVEHTIEELKTRPLQ